MENFSRIKKSLPKPPNARWVEGARLAVEFCKSNFAMLVFFGTLCIRPATKSKISARALTREETASLEEKTAGFFERR
ncbi:hypothetical protein HMPREF9225_0358 [Peptoniphilus duerdenii ATCC BAA-1640]|uniref:Uncharacterized protein n=1 Tax=Peptoniphilus duerdenii ATCC BAA-1640 TaxID=862517 RepID=E0NJL9_9FIRM|nr:hypothetical protein HMPREF9225_0358 [Peptoniphilus duerdenii ATCC BAA-1640]